MSGAILGGLGAAASILGNIVGTAISKLFGGKSTDEKLGIQETENANAQAALKEVETAVQARDDSAASDTVDPDRLRDGSSPAAGKYRPGPD